MPVRRLADVVPAFERHRLEVALGAALVATDLFVDEVADRSPYAAPVVRFLLEGALQYGFYELRKDDVNWPFDTDAPLVVDMFKLGVTTRF